MHIIHLNATSSLPFLYSSSLSFSLLVSFLLIVHRFLHLLAHARKRERTKRRDAFLMRERKREKGTVPDSDGIKCWWIKKKENLDEELFNEIYLFLSSKVIHTTTNAHEKSNHVSCVKHLSYPPSLIHTISYSYSFDPIASKQNRPRRREKDGWKVNESQS